MGWGWGWVARRRLKILRFGSVKMQFPMHEIHLVKVTNAKIFRLRRAEKYLTAYRSFTNPLPGSAEILKVKS